MEEPRMDAAGQIINLGAPMCQRLKNIYFADKHWSVCYRQVAEKFTQLKQRARKFYTTKTELEMLMELVAYDDTDIVDMLEIDLLPATGDGKG